MKPVFFLVLLISSNNLFSQLKNQFVQQEYTTENGLPSNGIKGLQWDENTGFLWIATEAGIARFNGVDFKTYNQQNSDLSTSERMLYMFKNKAGNIYSADQFGNLFVIKKNSPVVWSKKPGYNQFITNYLLLQVSDTIYKSTHTKLLTNNVGGDLDKLIAINDTSCLIQFPKGIYYYSTSMTKPVLEPYSKNNELAIFLINGYYFLLNSQKKVSIINVSKSTHTLSNATTSSAFQKIFSEQTDNSRLYWQTGMQNPVYISEDKAWLLTYENDTLDAKLIANGIPNESYISFVQYSQKYKLLFIGTESKGLIITYLKRLVSKKRKIGNIKKRNSVYSQIELSNGNILTNESDIIGDNTTVNQIPFKGKFSFNLSETDGNLLWFSQYDRAIGKECMQYYNKSNGKIKKFPSINSTCLVVSMNDRIYMANNFGIAALNEDTLQYLYKYQVNKGDIITFDCKEIKPGIIAIATCNGLLSYNITSNKLDTIFAKGNVCVRSIWKYKDYIFLGTYGDGYYISKNGIIKKMPLDKNNYLLYTHCFMPDSNGFCWISTNRGLFKCSLTDLIEAYENNIPTVYYYYFGRKDGMEMTELNGGCTPCALSLSNNVLSFPSMDGLLWVTPSKTTNILPEGEIYIDAIQVDDKFISEGPNTTIKLPAQTEEIIINLGYQAWCHNENIYIDYQFKDTLHWTPISNDKGASIRLSNLKSRKYILRIRKLNGFGKNNYTYKTIEFIIASPWFNQWWFAILVTSLMFGMYLGFYKIRTKQLIKKQLRLENQIAEKTTELQQKNKVLEKNNTINTRLISIISHDIITPLKFLTVAGKNLLEKKELMPNELKDETIKEITNTSNELQLLSTNILNWIKYQTENRRLLKEKINVHELVNQVFSILKSMSNQKNLQLVNLVDTNIEIYQFYEPLKILVYNLLTNAINFSERGIISISTVQTDKKIQLCVSDEGVGMTGEQLSNITGDEYIISSSNIDHKKGNGLGYLIIKDLLKMMNATFNIISEKNKGTNVFVEFQA